MAWGKIIQVLKRIKMHYPIDRFLQAASYNIVVRGREGEGGGGGGEGNVGVGECDKKSIGQTLIFCLGFIEIFIH